MDAPGGAGTVGSVGRPKTIRIALVVAAAILFLLLLAPVLFWDPLATNVGGDGRAALAEWSTLVRNHGNSDRIDQLAAGFGEIRSHRGKVWYTASDSDGTCWALLTEPVDVTPQEAPSPDWCQKR